MVLQTTLDTQRALPRRRQRQFGRDARRDARGETQPQQTGTGQNQHIKITPVQTRETGIDVAAHLAHVEVRKVRQQLATAAQAGRTYPGAVGQRVQCAPMPTDQCVAGVFAGADRRQSQAGRKIHGHVLHGVHRNIGGAGQQRLLQLLHKQPLAADRGQGPIQQTVTLGGEAQNFDRYGAAMETFEFGFDVVGLPEREGTFAGGDTQTLG